MSRKHFVLHWGLHGLLKLLADYRFRNVLDIGSGEGQHKAFLESLDKEVLSVDMTAAADYTGDFMDIDFDRQFDAIWCSHVLEHQRNVGQFLDKLYSLLKPGGVLAIIVPTHERDVLISGHITSWSIPLLCYNLVVAGFDCSKAAILNTYELSLIVEKKEAEHADRNQNSIFWSSSTYETGAKQEDANPFAHLEKFFPFAISQGCKVAGIGGINWGEITEYTFRTNKTIPTFESSNLTRHPNLTPNVKRKSI